jgi:hypothetical protein
MVRFFSTLYPVDLTLLMDQNCLALDAEKLYL